MDWIVIQQDVIAGVISSAFTIIIGTVLASILVPLWVRPRLKVKGLVKKGDWVSVIVKCKGREAARNAQGYLTLKTETYHKELLQPAKDEEPYFLLPVGDDALHVKDSHVYWAIRPNPRRPVIQPESTSLAHIGKFIEGGFTVMSKEGYEMEDDQGNIKKGRQRMRLNTSQKEYEFSFFASADNARPSKQIRFIVGNEIVERKPRWLWRVRSRD